MPSVTGYDLFGTITTVVIISAIVASLISIARHSSGMSSLATAVWSAVVIFAPYIGPIAWLVVGRPRARSAILVPYEPVR